MRESLKETRQEGVLEGWKKLQTPGDLSGFLEHGGNGAVFFLAECNRVARGGFVDLAANAIEDFDFFPDGGRSGGTFAGTDDFKGLQLLAFFLEDDDDVGGSAGTQSGEEEFHGAGRGIGITIGIERDSVAGRSNGDKFLAGDPFCGGGLHESPRVKKNAVPENSLASEKEMRSV